MATRTRAQDVAAGYGWISIGLHWLGAIAVLVLWFIGSSIGEGPDAAARVDLHTSIAMSLYVLLWLRVIWRLRVGHPQALNSQRGVGFAIGRLVHFALLVAIAAMLISGPLAVWLHADAIHVFGLTLDSPFAAHLEAAAFARRCHAWVGNVILLGTLLHIAGALKHLAFDRDRTFERMVIAHAREAPHASQGES